MAGESLAFLARRYFPELDFLVVTSRRQGRAIRRDGDRIQGVAMPFKEANQFAIRDIPLAHLAEQSSFPSRRKELLAVSGKDQRIHISAMPGQGAEQRMVFR